LLVEDAMAIITISREMGTGAYQIAKDVAKKLKFMLIDGAKLMELAPSYGLSRQIIDRIDEKPPSYITAEDRLQAAHLKTLELIILDCARAGNVIVYGRGGQDLLKGLENVLRLRFIAPFEQRVEAMAEREWIDPDLAREFIRKNDHQRGGFIHFYFDRNWNDPFGYDLIFNTERMSPASIVDTIVTAARDPKFKNRSADIALIEDRMLCFQVEAALLKSKKLGGHPLSVRVESGEVFLSGHIYAEGDREQVLKTVKKVKGVLDITDDMMVVNYKQFSDRVY
jgi:cytidylate kinase